MNGSLNTPDHTMTRITEALADYREGLARINREFDAAARTKDRAILDLQKDMAKHRPPLDEDTVYRLMAERKYEDASRDQRKSSWRSTLTRKWESIAAEAVHLNVRLRRHQPALVDLAPTASLAATEIPTNISFGAYRVGFENLACFVPHVLPFPFPHALALSEDNPAHKKWAHQLLLRLLSALPPGQLELTLVDPLRLGQSLEPFLSLLKVEQLVPEQRVLTRSDEIEAALGKVQDEVEQLIQHRFNDLSSNWSEHNANNADNPLPYKVLVLFNVPEQLSDKSLWFLQRICENGPRCGVLPIIAIDGARLQDPRYEKFRATINACTTAFDTLFNAGNSEHCGLSLTYQPEQWPRQDSLGSYFSALADLYAAKARLSKSMPDLWTDFAKGATTCGGFDIPIGWTSAGGPTPLILGATTSEHHALLAGKTGSGKSNLLHVLIHTLCERYSPAEVDLYLLDYKESTEFNIYADPPLPHARLVATESDPEYGVTVLQHLVGELEKRASMFKTVKVRDFVEYREATKAPLPRILLVIDEFQVLFAGNRPVAESAEHRLSQLLKQGRSFGIHILLATQTLKGINALSLGSIITQLGCRIALACGQEDSAMILGANNWAATELRSPPEGIINNANGAKSGNLKFSIPLAESSFCRTHIRRLADYATARGMSGKTKVFSGSHMPEPPVAIDYQSACAKQEVLLLGERLTFDADKLTVPLVHRSAFNVLFSGYNDPIHDGLLTTTLSSLAALDSFDEVIYFNGRGVTSDGGFLDASRALGTRLRVFDNVAELPLQAIADGIGTRRVALIIDGLDSEKQLYPSASYKPAKAGEPPSPGDLLKRIAEDGPRKGVFVFAFVERWQRCAALCKDLFAFFELRVAYCMNEDDAGSLLASGGIGKFKGIEKSNRAVLMNRMTNETSWFRPYVQKSSL